MMILAALVVAAGMLQLADPPEAPDPVYAGMEYNETKGEWNWDAHLCVTAGTCSGFVYAPTTNGVNLANCSKNFWDECSGDCKYCSSTPGASGLMCIQQDYKICTIGANGTQTCGTITHYKCTWASTPPTGQETTDSSCYCTTLTTTTTDPCVIANCQ